MLLIQLKDVDALHACRFTPTYASMHAHTQTAYHLYHLE